MERVITSKVYIVVEQVFFRPTSRATVCTRIAVINTRPYIVGPDPLADQVSTKGWLSSRAKFACASAQDRASTSFACMYTYVYISAQ